MHFFLTAIVLILLVGCNGEKALLNHESSKVKNLIKHNKTLLLNSLKQEKNKSITDLKSAVVFIKKIESGTCQTPSDESFFRATLSILSSFSYRENSKK